MPESMYDKLGDLLSKSMESGDFLKSKKEQASCSDSSTVPVKLEEIIPESIIKRLKVLKLERDATYPIAAKIFREKIKKLHPDLNGSKTETSKLLEDWYIIEQWKVSETKEKT